jgi:hypothetical protein
VVGRILLKTQPTTVTDCMGGQGVMAVPVVYNGWVQNLPAASNCYRFLTVER